MASPAALVFPAPAARQLNLEGYWVGTAAIDAEVTRFALRIERHGDERRGSIDLVDVGVLGWPAQAVSLQGAAIRVEFPSDRGLNVLSAHVAGETLQGRWAMAGERDVAIVSLARGEPPLAPRTSDLAFHNGGVALRGTVVTPRAKGPWPGVVFVHGAGAETRDASRFLATHYAQHGIASLIYDKRGAGESGGDWRSVGFAALAEDALAAVAALRQRPEVDASVVGLRGQSQGGWVAPLAASRSHDVAFVVTAAGPLVTPAEEGHWDALFALRAGSFPAAQIAEAEALLTKRDAAVRTEAWAGFRASLATARQRPWFEASGIEPEVLPDDWIWAWYRKVMDFDPLPVFERLTIPVLAQLGAEDESMPAEKSAAILERVRREGHKPYTILLYPSANHAMRKVARSPGLHWPAYADGYLDRQVEWILEQASRRSGG